jgi:hypothetical protein
MVAAGQGCDIKKRIIRPDGVQRVIRCVGMPVRENGVVTRFVGTLLDITEQEELAQELRRSKRHLANAQTLSHTGSFGWKVSSGKIFWSDETFRIFQCDPSTKPTVELLLSQVHREDYDRAHQQIERASREGEDFDCEYRLQLPGGSVKHVHLRAHALRDSSGNIEFLGAISDLTERKVSEEKIRNQEMDLRQMLDLAPQCVAVYGPRGERLYANRVLLEDIRRSKGDANQD